MEYKLTKKACYIGYFVQAIINNLSPLLFIVFQEDFGLSAAALSILVLINFITQLLVDALAVRVIPYLGERRAIIIAHLLSAVGLLSLGVLPVLLKGAYLAFLIPTVISAVGSGLIEVMISPIVDRIPSEKSSAEMSLLHSFYCIGHIGVIILSTLFFKFFGITNWQILPLLWAVVPLLNIFMFIRVSLPPEVSAAEKIPLRHLAKTKSFMMFALLMLCGGAAEQSIAQWASLFSEKTLGVTKTMGDLLGPCMFAFCMAFGRILYGFFGEKYPIKKALTLFSLLAVVSYFITALSPIAPLSLFGVAMCGFSVSIMWPGVFSLCSENYKNGGTPMFAVLALFGDLGCATGPFLTGMISDFSNNLSFVSDGLKFGILSAVIFPVIMFLLLLLYKKRKR